MDYYYSEQTFAASYYFEQTLAKAYIFVQTLTSVQPIKEDSKDSTTGFARKDRKK